MFGEWELEMKEFNLWDKQANKQPQEDDIKTDVQEKEGKCG